MINKLKNLAGFTLIEILVALMIMSIALAALLKTTGSNIHVTQRIKEKTYGHWVAMQAIKMIQLGFIDFAQKPYATEATTIFNEKWYWRAELRPTAMKNIQEIKVKVSKTETGPFQSPLIAFKYNSSF
ncbi:MAG: type II secretion system minor pseudopilin GspI [Proteobacteria bacterium]|nr:type II secretion system minor pseudopilin GspI [Pseudomonadota bacterium]